MSDNGSPDSKSSPPPVQPPKPSFSISSILGPKHDSADTERPDSGSDGETEDGPPEVTRSRDAVVFSLADIYSKFHVYPDTRLAARAFSQWYPWYPSLLHSALDYPGRDTFSFTLSPTLPQHTCLSKQLSLHAEELARLIVCSYP